MTGVLLYFSGFSSAFIVECVHSFSFDAFDWQFFFLSFLLSKRPSFFFRFSIYLSV